MNKTCPTQPVFLVSLLAFVASLFLFLPKVVLAAAPDGAGPWADSVFASSQGNMKNGLAVPAPRSNPDSAVGVAEDNTVEGNFFSLGFGGSITLKFDNPQSGGVVTVEATNLGYPTEQASVEVSENGSTWVSAGVVTQDGNVSVPQGVACVQFVRVKDTSNVDNFEDGTADGYDLDGVRLTGDACVPKTGDGGSTTVIIKNNQTCVVNQGSVLGVTSMQSAVVSTGSNKIKNTTGAGVAKIKTGKAKATNSLNVIGGSNVATGNCGCCSGCSSTNVTITGN